MIEFDLSPFLGVRQLRRCVALLLFSLLPVSIAFSAGFAGTFACKDPNLLLSLVVGTDSSLLGGMGSNTWNPLVGKTQGETFEGVVSMGTARMPVRGRLTGKGIELTLRLPSGDVVGTWMFERAEFDAAIIPTARRGREASDEPSLNERDVVVNGRKLTPRQHVVLELLSGLRFKLGDLYYVRPGLMGLVGGPVRFIVPDNLPFAPVDPEVAGGTDGIFVNGLNLHPDDVGAIRQIFRGLSAGNYTLDAAGNLARKDGPNVFSFVPPANNRVREISERRTSYIAAAGGGPFSPEPDYIEIIGATPPATRRKP